MNADVDKFYRIRSPIDQLYTFGNKNLTLVSMVNVLGIFLDRILCFSSHIENMIKPILFSFCKSDRSQGTTTKERKLDFIYYLFIYS